MRRLTSTITFCLSGIFSLAAPGCVEREELITVRRDGTVTMIVDFEADAESELYVGRVPAAVDGWHINRSQRIDDDGREKVRLTAQRPFPPDELLPSNFAPAGDPEAELFLQFPTSIWTERRDGVVWYHFRRVYTERPWAYVHVIERELRARHDLNDLNDLEGRALDKLNREQLVRVTRMLAEFEIEKKLVFARAAVEDLAPDRPPDCWLEIRQRVRAILETLDFDRLAALVQEVDEAGNDVLLELEARQFELDVIGAMHAALEDTCTWRGSELERFAERVAWHEKYFEITSDLETESFQVTVEMPGELVGANADNIDGNRATWRFSGKAMRDRDFELMVSSRVAR